MSESVFEDLANSLPNYLNHTTLNTPSPISAIAFGHSGHLFAGSGALFHPTPNDGSLRVYDLSSFKVCRAVSGLPTEISSIQCFKRPGSDLRDVWLACGRHAYSFQMDSPKLVQIAGDATAVIELCDAEDILNELAMNTGKTHLAFSTDSGSVGVLDLSTKLISRMKTSHSSICGIVRFIPDRPREIVSGGYDSSLLHFDFVQGTVLSRRDIPPFPIADGMSLSPPFIMSAAISATGVMAAGTADGRVWLGFGGEKGSQTKSTKTKRSRKWEGFNPDDQLLEKIAEGPIVAMAFSTPSTLTVSSLLGNITQYRIVRANDALQLVKIFQGQTKEITKVNALLIDSDAKRLVIAGLTKNAKGAVEIWNKEGPP
ncbi:WD40-repeat-containing domain protein [Mycena rosella]|uniref:WD40-repeat-containing domain protein n=1 Tax=Mycena rosella TaxID=1033263 RepID=A0AAD7H0X3_MYCRO|nr:WD40-repeat-containing domain protein [Mycena rosella]